jgi:predicted RNA-binding protein with PUA-like domain
MSRWLLKTEPDCYTWKDLQHDGQTVWDGVANALALKHIRAVRKGDEALIYHTGKERAAIGVARIISDPYPDPKQDDEKLAVFDLKPLRPLKHPVPLARIKADPAFAQWELVRMSRLSVMPVPDELWSRLMTMAEKT